MERGKKRKRNLDLPRITYHASDRTFERLFKEESLEEMEAVVRRKLGLPENASICLAQLREGKPIDLEDDGDFDAFYSIAHSTSSVHVGVTVAVDTTSSSVAPAVPTKEKQKTKTALAADPSLESPPCVAENEQMVMEGEATSPRTTEKESDIRKRTGGDNGILEGTSKPRKKRKEDKSGSIAVNETPCDPVPSSSNVVGLESERVAASPVPVAGQITGEETSISVSCPPATSGQSTSPLKKARRKQKLKSQALAVEPPASAHSPPTTRSDSTAKNSNKKDPPKSQRVPFADQLADAITETSESNRKHLGRLCKTSTGRKDSFTAENIITSAPGAIRGTLLTQHPSLSHRNDGKEVGSNETEPTPEDDVIGARKKKGNGKSRASTMDELEAANADVKAAFSRILAAKRVSLSSSLVDNSLVQHSKNADVPARGQHARHPETVTLQTTLNGKRDASYRPNALSELSGSKAVPAEGASNTGISDHTTRSSSRSSDKVREDQSQLGSTPFPIVPVDASLHANVDLDAIIRGPKVPVDAVGDIQSAASSEDEQDLDLAEDEEEVHTSRHVRGIAASNSSETDIQDDDDDSGSVDDNHRPLLGMDSRGSSFSHPDGDHVSFQPVDLEIQGADNSDEGVGSHTDLAADTGMFNAADNNDATLSVQDTVISDAENDETVAPSSGDTGVTSSPHPSRNSSQTVLPSPGRSLTDETSISLPERGSGAKQGGEGIIRRMKGRSGRQSEKDSTAGSLTKYNGQPGEFQLDSSSTIIPMDETNRKQASGGISQLIQQQVNKTVELGAKTFSQKSMSLDTWTTIKASSPPESTIMIDELRSSSPYSHSQANRGNSNPKPRSTNGNDPLFILTASQPPFPYSQWPNSPENRSALNDSEDEQEVHASIQPRSQPKTSQPPKYRRLTEIANQHAFFSTSTPKTRPARSSSNKLADMYGRSRAEEIESDSDTETDSDSDAQVDSHIPKSRIAGVSRQTRFELGSN